MLQTCLEVEINLLKISSLSSKMIVLLYLPTLMAKWGLQINHGFVDCAQLKIQKTLNIVEFATKMLLQTKVIFQGKADHIFQDCLNNKLSNKFLNFSLFQSKKKPKFHHQLKDGFVVFAHKWTCLIKNSAKHAAQIHQILNLFRDLRFTPNRILWKKALKIWA